MNKINLYVNTIYDQIMYYDSKEPYLSYQKNKSKPIAIMKYKKNNKLFKLIFINDGETFQINKKKEIINHNYNFYQIPNTDVQREILYVSAPQGAGKTTYVKNYIKEYIKVYPNNKIFLFSKLESDPSIDDIKKIKRIQINNDLVNEPIDIKELRNSCVIFDDVVTLRGKVRKAIFDLIDDIIIIGRRQKITCIVTSHLLCNYKETRDILNEMTSITVFPRASSYHNIYYCLKMHFGMDKKTINNIFKLNSRWVTIFKSYPKAILYDHGIYVLNNRDYLKD